MKLTEERPPAYSHHHIPPPLTVPDIPAGLPTAHRRAQSSQITLPDIKSLGLPDSNRTLPAINPGNQHQYAQPWPPTPQFNHISSVLPSPALRQSVEGSMSMDAIMHNDHEYHGYRAPSVMSIEDAETRAAAEALSGLRSADFLRSPSTRSTTVQPLAYEPQPPTPAVIKQEELPEQLSEPEPLLELLTTSHPRVAATINGPLAAYTNIKNVAPAFVRNSADYIERTIGRPIASSVESVGRRTGIESGVRRYLGERTPSDVDTRADNKRRRIRDERGEEMNVEADIEKGILSPSVYHYRSRASSQASFAESLPAYDSNRSPPYEESSTSTQATEQTNGGSNGNGFQLATQQRATAASRRGSSAYGWGQQLLITTSGLGVACSDSSLRSLKYCLNVLSQATDHVTVIMEALKQLLNEYQGAHHHSPTAEGFSEHQAAVAAETARKIRGMGNEIIGTLHKVVDHISRYAGGALPDNASALVRRQLLSVPQRWRAAAQDANASSQDHHDLTHQGPASPTSTIASHDDDAFKTGTRFVNFAVQGLDMFEQVGLVLSATIKSADKWLDSMGRRGSTANTTSHAAQQRRASVAQQQPQSAKFPSHTNGFVPINGFGTVPFSGGMQQPTAPVKVHVVSQPMDVDVVMGDDMTREKQ